MKKILLSLGTLVVVGAVVWGATAAFYNDTETSSGNIFVAGSIDLKVDHLKQTYNGVDCKTCDVEVWSDTSNDVIVKSLNASDPLAVPHSAKLVSNPHVRWTADVGDSRAKWIWATDPTLQNDTTQNVEYTFEKRFSWYGPFVGSSLSFAVGSDNSIVVYLNGHEIGNNNSEFGYQNPITIDASVINPFILQGENSLTFKVTNWGQTGGSPSSNPGGLLYYFDIDGNCGDAYFQTQCRLWQETDLTDQKFFRFDDIKPGDFGTNVISLHVYDNDAYACLITSDGVDDENEVMESEGNDTGPTGELQNYIDVFTWVDSDKDGEYDSNESALGGPLSLGQLGSIASYDDDYLTATTTEYIGLAWCAGTLGAVAGQEFSCDGSGMLNDAQSDSFSASLTAYAEQVRNNGAFRCADVELTPNDNGDSNDDGGGGPE